MDHHTREQRRRETEVRLVQSHADIATSVLGRAPRFAATSMRGGMLANTPFVLRTTSDRKEAEALRRRRESSGAVVEVRAS